MNQNRSNNTLRIINLMEQVLVEEEINIHDAFIASLVLATITANNLHMSEDSFLDSCKVVFATDKTEKFKELQ